MNAAEEPKKILKFGRRHSQRSLPNKERNGVAQEARKLQYL